MRFRSLKWGACLVIALFTGSTALHAEEYLFSAPPRGNAQEELDRYNPVLEFLSAKTGHTFRYQREDAWLTYQFNMLNNKYDLVFDGPHFVSWRIKERGHIPLLKLPVPHVWMVIVPNDSPAKTLDDLIAHEFCGHPTPNFGTLTFLSHYPNPVREPVLKRTLGWKHIYQAVADGKCASGVVPLANLKKFDPDGTHVKVLHQHKGYPNQAFTAGPRISRGLAEQITSLLQSAEGQAATQKLRDRYAGGKQLIPATIQEYAGISDVLADSYGYGTKFGDGYSNHLHSLADEMDGEKEDRR